MGLQVLFFVLCLAAMCNGLALPRGPGRKTPTRIGNLRLIVSQPGARIYKGVEVKAALSGGGPEPVETGAFRWFDNRPGGGYAAVAYHAGPDGYVPRFAYRARKESLPAGAPEPPEPLPTFSVSPSPRRPPLPPPPPPPPSRPLPATPRTGEYVPPSGVIQDTSFDNDNETDERVSNALMASLLNRG